MRKAFEEAVDDCLVYCAERGHQPLRPASGKISLRIPPEIHSAAEVSGKSVNQWISDALMKASYC
nr:toxin-antitoxin system HicB family antitoxin [Winslowiella toletana]